MSSHVKALVSNTFFLLTKLMLNLFASLYISRELLKILGFTDFGVFHVVAGVVLSLTFITSSLSSAVSRFFNYYIKRNNELLDNIFTTSILFHIVIIILVIGGGISFSNFFIYNLLEIPKSSQGQSALLIKYIIGVFCCNLLNITFISLMISYEHIKQFSYIGLIEILTKLIAILCLSFFENNKLVNYGLLLFISSIIISTIYLIYFYFVFFRKVVTFKWQYQRSLVSELFGFIGWNSFGALSVALRDHGVTIIINVFFGPLLNSARALAMQVNSAILSLTSQISVAVAPKIIEHVSNNNIKKSIKLTFNASLCSFLFVIVLSLPIILNVKFLLSIWIGNVPDYTSEFIILLIINLSIESLSGPFIPYLLAFGKIRNYQLAVGGINLLNLPLSYFMLKGGASIYSVFILSILVSLILFFLRVFIILKKSSSLKSIELHSYIKKVLLIICSVLVISPIGAFLDAGLLRFTINIFLSILYGVLVLWFIILDESFKKTLIEAIKDKYWN